MLSKSYNLKSAQEELREMEREFKIVMDNIPAVLFKGYLDGAVDFYDNKIEIMTGYSDEKFMSRSIKWTDLILEEDHDNTKMIFIRALKTNKAYVREYRIKTLHGKIIWIHERSQIVCDQNGKVEYVSGLFFDITDRKQLEDELRRTEQNYQIVLNNIPAVLFKGYLNGSIDAFDGKIEPMTGYAKEEFESRRLKWIDLILPEDLEQTKQIFIQALKTSKSYVREYRIMHKKGEVVWVHERSLIVCDAEGKVEHVSGLFFDITERKELEATVAERNSQLREANERLTQWANELEQRNYEISLLGKMGELLQSCNTSEEAYIGIRQTVEKLFPDDSGAVYLFNSSRKLLEAAAQWGAAPPFETVFAPDECWGLRRGRPHDLAEIAAGFRCRHVEPERSVYFCVPLMAQGEAIGVFHVLLESAESTQAANKMNLAVRLSDHLGLALAKLKLQETLQQLSVRDPLTGLFNRRYMEESMERELLRAERQSRKVGVIMLDIDHFKPFNDRFGHVAGDALLQELGRFLQRHVRGSDIACRYGGEEFTLIMQDASLEVTHQRAEQIRENVKELRVHQGTMVLDPITLSAGVALFPDHAKSRRTILQAADVALYRAKETGRDRVCLAGKD